MKKVGLLALAMVMALGALGVGYAYWTQNIYVNATVANGYVQAAFTTPQPNPTFVDTGVLGGTAGVAWYQSSIYATSGDVLTVTLSNAYPGMTATMPIAIRNTGSIPIGGIVGVSDPGTMPVGTAITLTAAELSTGLAVGASTSNAVITVQVPFGSSPSDPAFDQHGSYSFSMVITSTQFVASAPDQFDLATGVTAGKFGP
jgi:hypothetical protein